MEIDTSISNFIIVIAHKPPCVLNVGMGVKYILLKVSKVTPTSGEHGNTRGGCDNVPFEKEVKAQFSLWTGSVEYDIAALST